MTIHGTPTGERPGLAWYVTELIARLDDGDRPALDRLRTIVGSRRARIGLESEVVETWFDQRGALTVEDVTSRQGADADRSVDGEGHTRHQVVLALLAGDLEVTDAILDGDIEVRGSEDAVVAIFAAVDILTDCATRLPGLRELSERYVSEHAELPRPTATQRRRRTMWPPALVDPLEDDLLDALGLHLPSTII